MALRWPFKTKAKTSTTGTGSYTVDESSPSAGWRNFTEAVLDNDLADGDTVAYICIDMTVTGRVNLFEAGIGTWNNTTKVLSRTQVLQPSSTIISWGMGTRDLVVIDNPMLFLLLAGGTMTGILNILLNGSIINPGADVGLLVQRSSLAATGAGISIVCGSSGVARVNLGDVLDEDAGGLRYDNATNMLYFRTNGADGPRVDNAGVLRDSAGVAYGTGGGGGGDIPAGTVTDFYQAAAPSGWTRVTGIDDVVCMIVSAGSPGTESTDGWTINDLTASDESLSEDQMPEHFHEMNAFLGTVQSGAGASVMIGLSTLPGSSTTNAGSNDTHTHDIVSAGGWRPPAAYFLLASKN